MIGSVYIWQYFVCLTTSSEYIDKQWLSSLMYRFGPCALFTTECLPFNWIDGKKRMKMRSRHLCSQFHDTFTKPTAEGCREWIYFNRKMWDMHGRHPAARCVLFGLCTLQQSMGSVGSVTMEIDSPNGCPMGARWPLEIARTSISAGWAFSCQSLWFMVEGHIPLGVLSPMMSHQEMILPS